jgi:hypothetical protein
MVDIRCTMMHGENVSALQFDLEVNGPLIERWTIYPSMRAELAEMASQGLPSTPPAVLIPVRLPSIFLNVAEKPHLASIR